MLLILVNRALRLRVHLHQLMEHIVRGDTQVPLNKLYEPKKGEKGAFVTRGMPPHKGHQEVVKYLGDTFGSVIIVLGSSRAFTGEPPRNKVEREHMLRNPFTDFDRLFKEIDRMNKFAE